MSRGRPLFTGASYFPLRTNIINDDKIKILRAEHGHEGFSCLVYLWCSVYEKSYFKKWTTREKRLFCDDHKFSIVLVESILVTCFKEGLFDETLYEKYEILTSKTIQDLWSQHITIRRSRIEMLQEYMLVDLNKTIADKRKSLFFITNLQGEVKTLKENARSTRIQRKAIIEQPARPGEQLKIETSVEPVKKKPEPVIDDEVIYFTAGDLQTLISKRYEDLTNDIKSILSSKWYESYQRVANMILTTYPNLKISKFQITPAEYLNFCKTENPTQKEIEWIFLKMSSKGVDANSSMIVRMQNFLIYCREDNPPPKINATSKAVTKKMTLYDSQEGIDKTKTS